MRMIRVVWVVGLLVSVALCLFSAYGVMFFGWVRGTPLSTQESERARYNQSAWLWIAALSFVAGVVFSLILLWKGSKELGQDEREPETGTSRHH